MNKVPVDRAVEFVVDWRTISQIELKCDPTRREDAGIRHPKQLKLELSGKQSGPAVATNNCYSGPNH